MSKIAFIVSAIVIAAIMMFGIGLVGPEDVFASAKDQLCQGSGGSGGANCTHAGESNDLSTIIKNIVNILLFLVGAVAVIMIVISGFRYTTANGDQSSVKAAKDTLLYAIVGVIVAIASYAIVNFVLLRI